MNESCLNVFAITLALFLSIASYICVVSVNISFETTFQLASVSLYTFQSSASCLSCLYRTLYQRKHLYIYFFVYKRQRFPLGSLHTKRGERNCRRLDTKDERTPQQCCLLSSAGCRKINAVSLFFYLKDMMPLPVFKYK